ncbi:hypothetical protein ACIQKB_37555 [Streptomyces sp. NPDC092046]|uniref:hypothetical protein n=1 Tax=Streptomyces sp. NPDC092046 TaxID=3366009 RepID=UPI00380D7891
MTEQVLQFVDGPAGIKYVSGEPVAQGVRTNRLGKPARRERAANRSLTASGFIVAPTGGRKRFTNTKSLSAASAMPARSRTC